MSVLVVAQLTVTDMAALREEYAAPLQAINARHGVETVAAAPQADVVEGEAGTTVAILRFPSRAAFDAWYADPDYAPLLARRKALTDPARSSLTVLPDT